MYEDLFSFPFFIALILAFCFFDRLVKELFPHKERKPGEKRFGDCLVEVEQASPVAIPLLAVEQEERAPEYLRPRRVSGFHTQFLVHDIKGKDKISYVEIDHAGYLVGETHYADSSHEDQLLLM